MHQNTEENIRYVEQNKRNITNALIKMHVFNCSMFMISNYEYNSFEWIVNTREYHFTSVVFKRHVRKRLEYITINIVTA